MSQITVNDFVQALVARKPGSEAAPSFQLFGQFIGSWEWSGFDYPGDGSLIPTRGRWIFEWVLNGNAIQDIFMFEEAGSGLGEPSYAEYGTTIRFPLDGGQAWTSVWIGPMNKVVRVFQARQDGEGIILDSHNDQGEPVRWIFSDISDLTFHWRGQRSTDGGKTWILYEELHAKRK
jgi:hypothetical protein